MTCYKVLRATINSSHASCMQNFHQLREVYNKLDKHHTLILSLWLLPKHDYNTNSKRVLWLFVGCLFNCVTDNTSRDHRSGLRCGSVSISTNFPRAKLNYLLLQFQPKVSSCAEEVSKGLNNTPSCTMSAQLKVPMNPTACHRMILKKEERWWSVPAINKSVENARACAVYFSIFLNLFLAFSAFIQYFEERYSMCYACIDHFYHSNWQRRPHCAAIRTRNSMLRVPQWSSLCEQHLQ